jgi:hypothetical protein
MVSVFMESSKALAWSALSTGVLPRLTMCLGSRTELEKLLTTREGEIHREGVK